MVGGRRRCAEPRLGDPDGPLPDCSIVVALPDDACLLAEVQNVSRYLAAESAGQCGPCVFGLPTLSDAVRRSLARGVAGVAEVEAQRESSRVEVRVITRTARSVS